jgi:hypothetical protein
MVKKKKNKEDDYSDDEISLPSCRSNANIKPIASELYCRLRKGYELRCILNRTILHLYSMY